MKRRPCCFLGDSLASFSRPKNARRQSPIRALEHSRRAAKYNASGVTILIIVTTRRRSHGVSILFALYLPAAAARYYNAARVCTLRRRFITVYVQLHVGTQYNIILT